MHSPLSVGLRASFAGPEESGPSKKVHPFVLAVVRIIGRYMKWERKGVQQQGACTKHIPGCVTRGKVKTSGPVKMDMKRPRSDDSSDDAVSPPLTKRPREATVNVTESPHTALSSKNSFNFMRPFTGDTAALEYRICGLAEKCGGFPKMTGGGSCEGGISYRLSPEMRTALLAQNPDYLEQHYDCDLRFTRTHGVAGITGLRCKDEGRCWTERERRTLKMLCSHAVDSFHVETVHIGKEYWNTYDVVRAHAKADMLAQSGCFFAMRDLIDTVTERLYTQVGPRLEKEFRADVDKNTTTTSIYRRDVQAALAMALESSERRS
jgi:hypothetical protein